MKRISFRQAEPFQAVMMLGSMTRAAEHMQVSQPAVSRLIADLQETVGLTLFKRTRHGTIPTADAERLLVEVKSVYTGLDELTRRAHAIRDLEMGELKIGTISLYGNGLLPQIVADFLALHPGLSVRLEIDSHGRILDWLGSRRCEIGFVSLPANQDDLAVDRLAVKPALCVMPANHRLADKPLIQPADLANVPFISFPAETSTRFQIDSIFNRFGIQRDMRVEAGTHESVCNFVAAGVGVSIISPFSPHLRNNPALTFRPFDPPVLREIGLLVRKEQLSTAAREFRDFVIEHFRRTADAETA